ncbi:hypothetical protein [Nonomuraea typhae]|uniref:hypothetical protein n=1 Tax=Nonomuraea typhae TaxID=2603600 RepID=UPI0012F94260|nr:hypothetical protein [Nonomuraea typhae]
MHTHFHGYTWTGPTDLLRSADTPRRPDAPGFAASPVPPIHRGDWLLKDPDRIADNHEEAAGAVAWMVTVREALRPRIRYPDRIDQEQRIRNTADSLRGGFDQHWEEFVIGYELLHIAAICCPHRILPHPCPLERAQDAGPGAAPGGDGPVFRVGGAVTIPWYPW